MDSNSLAHTKWKCQYHIVFIPKYRKKVLYGKVRDDVREVIRTLCKYKNVEIFENVAYIMAYHADPTIPGTIDEWLDQFEMFSIYQVLPEILELWGTNLQTQVDAKKN